MKLAVSSFKIMWGEDRVKYPFIFVVRIKADFVIFSA